jgi:hypothetical protein
LHKELQLLDYLLEAKEAARLCKFFLRWTKSDGTNLHLMSEEALQE